MEIKIDMKNIHSFFLIWQIHKTMHIYRETCSIHIFIKSSRTKQGFINNLYSLTHVLLPYIRTICVSNHQHMRIYLFYFISTSKYSSFLCEKTDSSLINDQIEWSVEKWFVLKRNPLNHVMKKWIEFHQRREYKDYLSMSFSITYLDAIARSKISFNFFSLLPTCLSIILLVLILIKLYPQIFASPFTSTVLPVPGGP